MDAQKGLKVDTVIEDTTYPEKANIDYTNKENIAPVLKLNPVISEGTRKEEDKFKYNKDAGQFVCNARHLAIRKARTGKKGQNKNQSETHKEQLAFQQTDEFIHLTKERYKVEAKNSELKNGHGYDTASSTSLFGMEIQGATTIFAVKLKRILKLINEKE